MEPSWCVCLIPVCKMVSSKCCPPAASFIIAHSIETSVVGTPGMSLTCMACFSWVNSIKLLVAGMSQKWLLWATWYGTLMMCLSYSCIKGALIKVLPPTASFLIAHSTETSVAGTPGMSLTWMECFSWPHSIKLLAAGMSQKWLLWATWYETLIIFLSYSCV